MTLTPCMYIFICFDMWQWQCIKLNWWFPCRRDLSDRSWIANQLVHTRHNTLSTAILIWLFRISSVRLSLAHRRTRFIVHKWERKPPAHRKSGLIVHVVVSFSPRARVWGECSTIHSPPALPPPFFSFVKVEISSRTLIPLFRTGSIHSGSASWDECGRAFPDDLRVRSFPW